MANKKPVVLAILDGWGYTSETKGNAVALAKTPYFDNAYKKYPSTLIKASGLDVGLPKGQNGNSEAGHMNIGAGRVVKQDAVVIQEAIKNGTFYKNPAFMEAVQKARKNKSTLHLMGLLSDNNSPHAYPPHLYALLDLLERNHVKKIVLHLFTDGRDSYQHAALGMLQELKSKFKNGEVIGTIMGRFYGMERNKRWEYTAKAYNALVLGEAEVFTDSEEVIERAYNRRETDEFIKPAVIGKNKTEIKETRIKEKDAVIFFNLRSDRTRQITKCFTQSNFNKMNPGSFKRKKVLKNLEFIAMTDFGPDLDNIITAFPSQDIPETLPILLDGYKQLYISESEKYAHVTYFLNGGYKDKVGKSEWIKIPSPKVKHYDVRPEMSADKITKTVIKKLKANQYDFILINYANPDMVSHTGNLKASIKAVEVVDQQLAKLSSEILKKNGTLLITADHGNVEELINLKTNEIDTKHSDNPVPFVIVSKELKNIKLKKDNQARLGDIAPTILKIMGIKKSKLMTGKSIWI